MFVYVLPLFGHKDNVSSNAYATHEWDKFSKFTVVSLYLYEIMYLCMLLMKLVSDMFTHCELYTWELYWFVFSRIQEHDTHKQSLFKERIPFYVQILKTFQIQFIHQSVCNTCITLFIYLFCNTSTTLFIYLYYTTRITCNTYLYCNACITCSIYLYCNACITCNTYLYCNACITCSIYLYCNTCITYSIYCFVWLQYVR